VRIFSLAARIPRAHLVFDVCRLFRVVNALARTRKCFPDAPTAIARSSRVSVLLLALRVWSAASICELK
jgi:hypothetical protein